MGRIGRFFKKIFIGQDYRNLPANSFDIGEYSIRITDPYFLDNNALYGNVVVSCKGKVVYRHRDDVIISLYTSAFSYSLKKATEDADSSSVITFYQGHRFHAMGLTAS